MEIGAQWAIAKKDVDMFERYMAQLKCYYLDYRFQFRLSAIFNPQFSVKGKGKGRALAIAPLSN